MHHSIQALEDDEPTCELTERQVRQVAGDLVRYHAQFDDLFYRKEQVHWGLKYVQGLLLPDCDKSIEGMAQAVEGGQRAQHAAVSGPGRMGR